jgi:NADPH:quinone reductase-like Zn-dependent oxidoreductase
MPVTRTRPQAASRSGPTSALEGTADRTGMEAIAALVEDGALDVRVAKTFPLEQAARAHQLGESGQTGGGKLVLTID